MASEKSARNALSDLVKNDKEYANALSEHLRYSSQLIGYNQKQTAVYSKALSSLRKGKIDSNVYDALNLSLATHGSKVADTVQKGFYNKLKSLGYDAVSDLNDKKWSGFHSSNPIIVFNSAKAKVDQVRELPMSEILKSKKSGVVDIYIKEMAPQLALSAASLGGAKLMNAELNRKNDVAIVKKYRKEHPNSTLSVNEILKRAKR